MARGSAKEDSLKRFPFFVLSLFFGAALALGQTPTVKKPNEYLGKWSSNTYDADSVSNPFGKYGNPYGNTINNPYSQYGSPYSPSGVRNRFATGSASPYLVGEDGKYLGNLNSNPHDPNSISNPYGRYGSRFSPDSVNNPYGKYGGRFSPHSANNPYAVQTPKIFAPSPSPAPVTKKPTGYLNWLNDPYK